MKKICIILIVLLLGVIMSCKKDNNNIPQDPIKDYNYCSDHILKEPYIIYEGDNTGWAVMVQTTNYVSNMGKVLINFGTDGNFWGWKEMAHHNFTRNMGQDYSIWRYRWDAGELTINKKINYIVNVQYLGIDHRFDGWFYTTAASHNDFSFYAFGDTRDGGDDYASCMNAIAHDMDGDYYKRYRLLLHMGDFVYNGARQFYYASDQNWNDLFFGRNCINNGGNRDKALWILSHVPVMGTLGNHDFWWDGHANENTARYYISNWPYKMYENSTGLTLNDACAKLQNDRHIKECYYSFDYGIVHFISLNSYALHDTTSSQYKWLENDLIKNDQCWTVVFFHEPMYNGKGVNFPCNQSIADAFSPLFKKYGVDIVLQGHQHVYTRVTIDKGTKDEIPYLILGRGGVSVECSYKHPLADAYSEVIHFARFDVTSNRDSMHVLVTEKHWNNPGDVDNFYFKNRPKSN